ncbi:hypothetical protein [[Acholeplasma] multilocale]|uniref:hypothetical protein n=1 Tax=[Acholeplasma] multilocale TaxID=264638 RepID=UPI00047E875B|nr:hypothetical protein [[Acholeplasma] multilocale]
MNNRNEDILNDDVKARKIKELEDELQKLKQTKVANAPEELTEMEILRLKRMKQNAGAFGFPESNEDGSIEKPKPNSGSFAVRTQKLKAFKKMTITSIVFASLLATSLIATMVMIGSHGFYDWNIWVLVSHVIEAIVIFGVIVLDVISLNTKYVEEETTSKIFKASASVEWFIGVLILIWTIVSNIVFPSYQNGYYGASGFMSFLFYSGIVVSAVLVVTSSRKYKLTKAM